MGKFLENFSGFYEPRHRSGEVKFKINYATPDTGATAEELAECKEAAKRFDIDRPVRSPKKH